MNKINSNQNTYIAVGIGVFYSILVSLYFFKPGYLRGLDYFFPLFGGIGEPGSNGFILGILTTLNNDIIPPYILEKIIIVLSFFLPFLGGALLLKRTKSVGSMVFAGIFLTCNPYFYDRFVDGQLGMYLLFCTIPFWIRGLHRFFAYKNPCLSRYILLVFLSVLTTTISMHGSFFLLVSFLVFSCVYIDYNDIATYLKKISIVGVSILLANAYRIVPNLASQNGAIQAIRQFDHQDLSIFQNYIGHANNYITTLSLQGYRGEGQQRFIPSYGVIQYPFLVFFFLLFIIVIGLLYQLSSGNIRQRKLTTSLIILTVIGFILGLGTAGETVFAGLTRFLYDHIPIYAAMRESHKWVLFMVIGYAYFGGYGVYALGKYLSFKYKDVFIGLSSVILILGYTPSIFSLGKQIPVVDYPVERYNLRNNLLNKKNAENERILILPWHQYFGLSFTKRRVLNPTESFFYPLPIIQGDNIEIRGIYSQGTDPAKNMVSGYIQSMHTFMTNPENLDLFLQELIDAHFGYILLLKEVDYENYTSRLGYLSSQGRIRKEVDNVHFTLYNIQY